MTVSDPDGIFEKLFEFSAEPASLFDEILFPAREAGFQEQRVFLHNSGKKQMAFERKRSIIIHIYSYLFISDFVTVYVEEN